MMIYKNPITEINIIHFINIIYNILNYNLSGVLCVVGFFN